MFWRRGLAAIGVWILGASLVALACEGNCGAYRQELSQAWAAVKASEEITRVWEVEATLGHEGVPAALQLARNYEMSLTPLASEEELRGYVKVMHRIVEGEDSLIGDADAEPNARGKALRRLGLTGPNAGFLPALRLIATSPHEPYYVRYHALTALSQIPHGGLIDELIEFIDGSDLTARAAEQLSKLTGSTVVFDPTDLAKTRNNWRAWWEQNKGSFVYERNRVLVEW